MLKQSLALIGLTLSIGANAAPVTYTFEILGDTWDTGIRFSGMFTADLQCHSWGVCQSTTVDQVSEFSVTAYGINGGTLMLEDNLGGAELTSFEFAVGLPSSPEVPRFSFNIEAPDGGCGLVCDLNGGPVIEFDASGYYMFATHWSGLPIEYDQSFQPQSRIFQTDGLPAVPIPAAAWLFGSALLGLGVVKRRKA